MCVTCLNMWSKIHVVLHKLLSSSPCRKVGNICLGAFIRSIVAVNHPSLLWFMTLLNTTTWQTAWFLINPAEIAVNFNLALILSWDPQSSVFSNLSLPTKLDVQRRKQRSRWLVPWPDSSIMGSRPWASRRSAKLHFPGQPYSFHRELSSF